MSSRQSIVVAAAGWVLVLCLRVAASQQPPVPPVSPPPAATTAPVAAPGAERSTLAGVYTDKQADRGSDVFGSLCTGCHTTASNKGTSFKNFWAGTSAWDLVSKIGDEMPKDDPGSLSMRETTDVVAYFFRLNGMPAGSVDLPQDEAALRKIKIELPKSHD